MYVNMNRYVQVALRRFLIVAIVRILLQDISQQTIYLLDTSRSSVLKFFIPNVHQRASVRSRDVLTTSMMWHSDKYERRSGHASSVWGRCGVSACLAGPVLPLINGRY